MTKTIIRENLEKVLLTESNSEFFLNIILFADSYKIYTIVRFTVILQVNSALDEDFEKYSTCYRMQQKHVFAKKLVLNKIFSFSFLGMENKILSKKLISSGFILKI